MVIKSISDLNLSELSSLAKGRTVAMNPNREPDPILRDAMERQRCAQVEVTVIETLSTIPLARRMEILKRVIEFYDSIAAEKPTPPKPLPPVVYPANRCPVMHSQPESGPGGMQCDKQIGHEGPHQIGPFQRATPKAPVMIARCPELHPHQEHQGDHQCQRHQGHTGSHQIGFFEW